MCVYIYIYIYIIITRIRAAPNASLLLAALSAYLRNCICLLDPRRLHRAIGVTYLKSSRDGFESCLRATDSSRPRSLVDVITCLLWLFCSFCLFRLFSSRPRSLVSTRGRMPADIVSCVCTYIYLSVYVYIYIYRERERDR